MDSRRFYFFSWLFCNYKRIRKGRLQRQLSFSRVFRGVSFVFVISVAIFLHRFLFFLPRVQVGGNLPWISQTWQRLKLQDEFLFAKSLLVGAMLVSGQLNSNVWMACQPLSLVLVC